MAGHSNKAAGRKQAALAYNSFFQHFGAPFSVHLQNKGLGRKAFLNTHKRFTIRSMESRRHKNALNFFPTHYPLIWLADSMKPGAIGTMGDAFKLSIVYTRVGQFILSQLNAPFPSGQQFGGHMAWSFPGFQIKEITSPTWACWGLNLRPFPCKGNALPLNYGPSPSPATLFNIALFIQSHACVQSKLCL